MFVDELPCQIINEYPAGAWGESAATLIISIMKKYRRRGRSNAPNCPNEESDDARYLVSPASVTAVASLSPYDDDSEDAASEMVPSPLTVSPNSSPPSSPKGSLAGDSNSSSASNSSAATQSTDEVNDAPPSQHNVIHGGEDDPYADVRDRMEALSLRDKTRHVYNNKTGEAEPSAPHTNTHQDITIFAAITTYLGYIVLIVTGHIRDICANVFGQGRYFRSKKVNCNNNKNHNNDEQRQVGAGGGNYPSDDMTKYAPLLKSWENFYTRRLYHRIQDCFNRPIASRPSAVISVLERVSFDGNKTMSILGQLSKLDDDGEAESYRSGGHYDETSDGRVVRKCLNLGSYNYLGFADDWDITCRDDVMSTLDGLPSSIGSSRMEFGTTRLHRKVERIVASFVGKEDAVVLNMGFNTNATVIPTLTSRGDLIVSDELNHTSIVNGARASGASIRTFRHNDSTDLELILREAIVYGQPRTRRPWNRILVVVEGIYSMEGEYCDLRNVVAVCKKYGAYVYLDEAHSIGAMGVTGRGCCEYTGVDPRDVDIMMGTFTKSFGGMGGYVAADKRVVDELRKDSAGSA